MLPIYDCQERYQQPQICKWYHSNGRKWRGTRVSWLFRMKEESEKAGLKLNIHKIKIMASSSITSWQKKEGKWKQWQILFSWAPKSLQMVTIATKFKKNLLLGKKTVTSLESILKSRDITLQTKVYIVKTMAFPVVMYRCESWTITKVNCRRTDAFELWCWRTLESPLNSKEIKPVNPKRNQPWIFIGRTDAAAETPKLWPLDGEELTYWKRPWCWEILRERGEGGDRGWDGWMASATQWTWVWASSGR